MKESVVFGREKYWKRRMENFRSNNSVLSSSKRSKHDCDAQMASFCPLALKAFTILKQEEFRWRAQVRKKQQVVDINSPAKYI